MPIYGALVVTFNSAFCNETLLLCLFREWHNRLDSAMIS